NIGHPRFWTDSHRRPVLSTVSVRTELCTVAGYRLVRRVNLRSARFRIEALRNILKHVRLSFDVLDRSRTAFEKPQITIARDVDQTFVGSAIALEVHEDRRRDLVIVP